MMQFRISCFTFPIRLTRTEGGQISLRIFSRATKEEAALIPQGDPLFVYPMDQKFRNPAAVVVAARGCLRLTV